MSAFDEVLGECPFEGCGMPYSLEDQRVFPSSDPIGATAVNFYRCLMGHHWPVPEEAPDV